MVTCGYRSLYLRTSFESACFYAELFQLAQYCFCCRSSFYQCPIAFKKIGFKGNSETSAAVWDDGKNLHSARKLRQQTKHLLALFILGEQIPAVVMGECM